MAATQLLYGYDHPYGHPQWGNPAIIKGLKPADLKRFYETHMRPEQAAVIAVGDVALDELKQQLEAVAWDRGSRPRPLPRPIPISRCPSRGRRRWC